MLLYSSIPLSPAASLFRRDSFSSSTSSSGLMSSVARLQ